MADLRIADAPEIALENITGNEKIPTGGYGNSAVTINILGQFAKNTLSLATEEYVSNAVGQKENKITLTGLNLTPTPTSVEIPQTNNSVLNTIHQDLLNRMEWIKDNATVITDHQALTNRSTFNTHPSSSISHNGTSNVSIEIEELKNDVLTINTETIPELNNTIIGKQEVIVNDINLNATPELTSVPSTNNSALNSSLQALLNRNEFLNFQFKKGVYPLFDQSFADVMNGYPIGSELVLSDGFTSVINTKSNNKTDPNSDMSSWMYSSIPQVESIAQMRSLNPAKKGGKVYLSSWHEGLGLGGGVFVATQKNSLSDDGGMIIATQNPLIFYVRINYERVTPLMFGAKGDGVYDDLPAFQAAVNFLWNGRGGEVFVPTPTVEYRWKSYDSDNNTCLYIPESKRGPYVDPIVLRGEGKLNMIKVDLSSSAPAGIKSAIKLGGGGHYRAIENLSVWGGILSTVPYVDYVLHAADNYSPNLTLTNLQFYVAKINCIRLATYVSTLTGVTVAYAPRGFYVDKPEGSGSAPCTSITFNNCYALNCTEYGYWCGELTYSTFLSCAADHIISPDGSVEAYPYYIDIARGVGFVNCGAESSSRMIHVRAAQGLTINGFMTLSIGLVESGQPAPTTLIRIDGGYNTVISGVYNHNSLPFTYKLSVGNTFARETVVVLDSSIEPSEATFTPGAGREKPILFLAFQKSIVTRNLQLTNTGDATTNAQNMAKWAKYSYDLELVHTLTIQFPSGDFPINLAVYLANLGTSGYARVRLLGNADGTSRIVCTGSGSVSFGVPNILARMSYTMENITIHADSGITSGVRPVLIYNANVYMINSKITSHNGAVQYAITSDSRIILDANSSIQTPALTSGIVEYSYKATTPPVTSTRLPVGTVFNASNPDFTRTGWINIVDNGLNWLPIGVSTPSGVTASRPTSGIVVGTQYFDTTLGKPIFVKTTSPLVWVDSTGTTV